jgi:hypothetical protein
MPATLETSHLDRRSYFCLLATLSCACVFSGCERTEKIAEINTPAGGVQVRKTTTTMPSGLEVKPTGTTKIEVETTKPHN